MRLFRKKKCLHLKNVRYKRYSKNYVRNKHPLIIRFIAIWRILTCRNFILVDFFEFKENNQNKRKIRPLYRTDYNAESEYLSLLGALDMTKKKI